MANEVLNEQIRNFSQKASYEILPKYVTAGIGRYLAPKTSVFIGHQSCDDEYMTEMLNALKTLKAEHLNPVPHVAARRLPSANFLSDMMNEIHGLGVDHLLVVGGDTPEPLGPYANSMDILTSGYIDRFSKIDIAAYPDSHRNIPESVQIDCLKQKLSFIKENGQTAGISTLLSFNHLSIINWADKNAPIVGNTPIRATISGPCSTYDKARFAYKFGQTKMLSYLFSQRAAMANIAASTPDKIVSHLAASAIDIAPRFSTFSQVADCVSYVKSLQSDGLSTSTRPSRALNRE